MRVLHVITTINRGGAENHLVDLALGQKQRGLDVTVAYLKGDHYWCARLRDAGIAVEPLDLARYGDVAPIVRLRKLIAGSKPDLIHAHLPPAELYTRLALLGRGRPPLVISKHNNEPFFRGAGHQALGRWVARRAGHIIAISDATLAYMRAYLGDSAPSQSRIHYGIDCAPFDAAGDADRQRLRAQWGIADGELAIGTIARLVPQKALHVLLAAFARCRSIGKRPARLVIVGQGPLLQELQDTARRLDLSDAVVWAGFRDDIPAVLRAFDVFALSSAYEGFGLVMLEAMAARRPVVATSVSAAPEIVDDGVTGVLCGAGDVEGMAQAFARLEDDNVRRTLGEAGGRRARELFTLDHMVDATLAVYRACLV